MSQEILNYLFIGLSFALYIFIAFRSRAGSTTEFYVAGGGSFTFSKWDGDGSGLDERGHIYFNGGYGGD